jgi:hypothetical protein
MIPAVVKTDKPAASKKRTGMTFSVLFRFVPGCSENGWSFAAAAIGFSDVRCVMTALSG